MDFKNIDYHQVKADPTSCISPNASIVGNVSIGAQCSIFAGAHIRGDDAVVVIEDGSNVQEGALLHVDIDIPLIVRKNVTIGHGAIVHGCEIGENTIIGMGAIIMNNARIGKNSIVAAGALVSEGKVFEDGSLIVGMPGKPVRQLSPEEIGKCTQSALDYIQMSQRMVEEGAMFHPDSKMNMLVADC